MKVGQERVNGKGCERHKGVKGKGGRKTEREEEERRGKGERRQEREVRRTEETIRRQLKRESKER